MDCIPLTLARDQLVGSCAHGNKTVDYINCSQFLGKLMNKQTLKRISSIELNLVCYACIDCCCSFSD